MNRVACKRSVLVSAALAAALLAWQVVSASAAAPQRGSSEPQQSRQQSMQHMMRPVDEGVIGLRVDLQHEPVGARGDSGQRERSDEARVAGAVGRINDHGLDLLTQHPALGINLAHSHFNHVTQ